MNEENHLGYVYILTNPSFKEDWVKIGKSLRPVDNSSESYQSPKYFSYQGKTLWEIRLEREKKIDMCLCMV